MTHPALAAVPSSAAIESAAADFDKLGPAVDDVMYTVTGAWSRLSAADVLQTPDSGQVFAALSRPAALASTIGQDAADAKKALNDYISTLADLEKRRSALLEEQVTSDQAVLADPVPVPGSSGTLAADGAQSDAVQQRLDLDGRVHLFNAAVDQADEDCAVALLRLVRDPLTGARNVASMVGEVAEDPRAVFGLEAAGKSLALSAEVRPTFQAIMNARASGQALFRYSPPDMQQVGRDLRAAWKPDFGSASHVEIGPAENAGRYLGAAGVAVSGVTTFADQWSEDEVSHEDWSTVQRVAHSGEHALAVAGGSVVGADIGTGVGEVLGAAAGEAIFPLGGGLIGGFIGGVIGGAVGGKIGEMTAGGLTDLVDDVANW